MAIEVNAGTQDYSMKTSKPMERLERLSPTDLVKVHYQMQSGIFFSEVKEEEGGTTAFCKFTPAPMWNHSAWHGGSESQFQEFMRGSREWLEEQNRQPVLYLSGEREADAALSNGFEKFDEEAWMVFEGGPLEVESKPEFRVIEVQNESALKDFSKTFYSVFQIKDPGYGKALRATTSESGARQRHFIAYYNRVPVSVGTIIENGAHACIYNVGTPIAFRKQGHAGRLIRWMVNAALDRRLTVFLQVEAESAAQELYKKIGFKTEFTRRGFRLKGWKSCGKSTIGPAGLAALLAPAAKEAVALPRAYLREFKAVDPGLISKIENYCQAKNIPAQSFLSGSIAALVHRYTSEDDVTLAVSPAPGDVRRIKVRVDRNGPAANFIEKFGDFLSEARASGSAAQTNGCELIVRFVNASQSSAQPEFPFEIRIVPQDLSKIEFSFRADLFQKDAIRRLTNHLICLLESFLARPNSTIGELNILTSPERRQLLVEWNQAADIARTTQTIKQLFEAQVEKTPEAQALLLAPADSDAVSDQLTYRQLNRRANRLAHKLQSLGVGPETMVGIYLERSLDIVVALLAVFKAGGTCVPLDPAYPQERIRFMLADTKAPVVVTQQKLAFNLEESKNIKVLCLDSDWPVISKESEKNPGATAGPNHAAYVIYTSGSTGQPKGVVITNYAIANHTVDCQKAYGLSASDKVLQFSSFNFDASLEQILPALLSGATLVLRDEEVWTTSQFNQKLAALALTVADIPTAYWHQLVEEWHKNPASLPNHNLRLMIVGGEAINPEKLALWLQSSISRVRLINAYGPTEATITATTYEISNDSLLGTSSAPIGRPRGERKIYILDSYGNPSPVGLPGELHIGGSLLARGYLNRPQLTEAKFIPNPFSDEAEDRLYKSGDMARYLEDGNIEFLGRVDDQVKIRGFRVELGEIESALAQHSGVREAIVLARPDSAGEKRLVGYVLGDPAILHSKELRTFLRAKLPDYMVPSAIVVLANWPLNPNGKIDRRALPEPPEIQEGQNLSGPRDPLELQVQIVFERTLRKAPIGIDISFFELGGDSLQALELLVELERATGKSLPLGTLYQSSTIESLANEIRSREGSTKWSCLVPMQTGGTRPPFYLVHTTPGDILGYGNLVYRLGREQPCYGFQSLGLKSGELAHTEIGQMARHYVELLRQHQPRGPYYLGGWCYGGVVAVEMARMLEAAGEKVALLALLETVGMAPSVLNARYFIHRIACLLRMSPQRWGSYVRSKVKYLRDVRMANRMRFKQVEAEGRLRNDTERDPRMA